MTEQLAELEQPKTWSYSIDGDCYYGNFATREEAIQEAKAVYQNGSFYIGECEKPELDGGFLDGMSVLEQLADSEDFMIDAAADWFEKVDKHSDSLGEMLRAAFHRWLEQNQLQPDFFIVKNPEYILADDEVEEEKENDHE